MSIDPNTYAQVMRYVAPLMAAAFWTVTLWLLYLWRHRRQGAGVWALVAWTGNVACLWTVLAYWRIAAGSIPQTWIMPINMWSAIVYFQAAFSLLFGLYIVHSLPLGQPTLTTSEFGPDDD